MEKAPERSEQFFRRLFYTIARGSSSVTYEKEEVYVRHFTFEEQGHIEEAYHEAFEKAKNQGLDTEKDCYEFLEEQGIWTKEEELELQGHKDYLDNLLATRKKLAVPSQIDGISKDITNAQEKIEEIEIKKRGLLPETCESYGLKKSNDLIIYYSYYEDKEGKSRLFSYQQYKELSTEELKTLFDIYSAVAIDISIENIKHLALSDFFTLYANILGSKNIHKLFGKPLTEHTFYQLHLLNYAKIFNSILENAQNIPDNVRGDPDLLLDFASSASKADEMRQKSQEKGGYSVMGASQQEMRDMGIDDGLGVNLHDLAAKKGGKLTMEDFVNLS
tara:strand:- start:78 stop:1073 length:996 start_codon:yes stop_codon:yes gene_type:complete